MADKMLLVLQLVLSIVHNCWSWANDVREMTDCRGGYLLHFRSGEPMELCCRIDNMACNQSSDFLTFKKLVDGEKVDVGGAVTTTGNESTVKLTIPSPVPDNDTGMFYCHCAKRSLVSAMVVVIDNMGPPTILSVTSTMEELVTVTFDPGDWDGDMYDNYRVLARVAANTSRFKPKTVVMCQNETITCTTRCICQNNIDVSKYGVQYVQNRNVTFVVVKKRSIRLKETKVVVNLLHRVKPEPINDVRVEHVSSTSSVLAICAPDCLGCRSVIMRMARIKQPLAIELAIAKTQGSYETRSYKLTFQYESCVRIPLTRLTPFTKYDVTVTPSGGGGNGLSTSETFITHGAAPTSPPQHVVYWIVRNPPANHSTANYAININWKPAPHDERGGNISYRLIATYTYRMRKTVYNTVVTESNWILYDVPNTLIRIQIYSKNNIGLSKSFNTIVIKKFPEHAAIERLQSYAAVADDQAELFVEKMPPRTMISAIYWCIASIYPYSPSTPECKEFPRNVLNGKYLRVERRDMLGASVRLDNEKCQVDTFSESTQETYTTYRGRRSECKLPRCKKTVTVVREFVKDNGVCTPPSQTDDVSRDSIFMLTVTGSRRLFPFKCYRDKHTNDVRPSTCQWSRIFSPQNHNANHLGTKTHFPFLRSNRELHIQILTAGLLGTLLGPDIKMSISFNITTK